MSGPTFFAYLITWALVAVTPGPAVMCSMAQATRYGFRRSLVGISGIQTGNFIFFASIALGLGALLETASILFTLIRTIGAIYLLYLGARIVFFTFRRHQNEIKTALKTPAHPGLFLQGLLIQVTNPKALLFVSALLPQFINANAPAVPQLIVLVIATIVIDTIVLSSYAYLAESGVRTLRDSAISKWLERIFGAALVFFGLRLMAARK